MDKKFGKKGLRILAPEVQGSAVGDIEALVKEHKITYPIMKGSTRAPNMRGIPHSVVFNAKGDLVFEGHPMSDEFEDSIKDALKEVDMADEGDEDDFFAKFKPLIEERKWTNSEGKPLVASVIAIKEDEVVFKLKNGREVPYPITKLSEEDQKLIEEKKDSEEEE